MRRTNALLKPGRVIYIRVNPKDCMSCIDVVQKTGMNLRGASFSLIASAALSSALESFRQNGIIPEREGFEYEEMMQDYPMADKQGRARALAITKVFKMPSSNLVVPPVVQGPKEDPRKRTRFNELAARMSADPDNMDSAEKEEFKQLTLELYPM